MKQIEIDDSVILIRISQAYRPNMTMIELYDYTRGQWRLDPERASHAKYGLAVYKGIVQEVYSILSWYKAGSTLSTRHGNENIERGRNERMEGRYEFIGNLAPDHIRKKYKNKSVAHFFKQGQSNPVSYINVEK